MRRRGFTLLEVLLAMTLMALMIGLIQGTYSGTVKSRRRSAAEVQGVHAAALALDRIANELASAYSSAAAPKATGVVGTADSNEVTTLSFTTSLPAVPGSQPAGGAEVGYFVEADSEGVYRLYRREDRDVDGDLLEGGIPYEVLSGVTRFQALFYDGEEWVEEWDSRERSEPPILPLSVSVEIGWGDEDAPRTLRTAARVMRAVKKP